MNEYFKTIKSNPSVFLKNRRGLKLVTFMGHDLCFAEIALLNLLPFPCRIMWSSRYTPRVPKDPLDHRSCESRV